MVLGERNRARRTETEAAQTAATTPAPLTPLPEREYIDVKRAARILGLSHTTVLELYAAGQIEMIDYAKRKRKRVRYQSVVDFCDGLRRKHGIADRRPRLDAPYLRHRDVDLLPFPLEDTIGVEEVIQILGYSTGSPIYLMIEEGRFEAYQVSDRNPWRISRSSLARYLSKSRKMLRPPAQNGCETWL